VKSEKTSIAKQLLAKCYFRGSERAKQYSKPLTGKHTTIGVLLGTVFSVRSVKSGYKEEFSREY
jgi:hypothetical protein